jgi:beta-barrel assembly-enhancing protease
MRILLILLPALLALTGCSSLSSLIPVEFDKSIGSQFAAQIESDTYSTEILDSVKYAHVYTYVKNIRNEIINSDDINYKNDFPYTVKIIKDDSTLNAFCVPGGYIYVYTGLLKYLDSESELAGVMAHEIAHAEKRHSVEQIAKKSGIALVLSYFLGSDMSDLVNVGTELLALNFSRSDEKEADEYAVKYLYDTRYDPRGVAGFFQKLIKEHKDAEIPEFLSTHPASQSRIDEIYANWKDLGSKEGEKGTESHQKIKKLL